MTSTRPPVRALVCAVLWLGTPLAFSGLAQAAPPCSESGARLAVTVGVKRTSACGGDPASLFVGDALAVDAGRSVRLTARDGAALSDILCTNESGKPVKVAVGASGAPPRLTVDGLACGAWQDHELGCAGAGGTPFSCSSYPRKAATAGMDLASLQPRAGLAVRGTPDPIFGDQRLAVWGDLLMKGQRDKLVRAVEQDLTLASPHVLAPYVWCVAHQLKGDLAAPVSDDKLKKALGELPRLYALELEGKTHEIVASLDEDKLAATTEPFSLLIAGWAAAAENRADLRRAAAIALLRTQVDLYWAVEAIGSALAVDHGLRTFVVASLAESDTLRAHAAGHYLGVLVGGKGAAASGPSHAASTEDAAVAAWLVERPHDVSAMAARAQLLAGAGHDIDALPLLVESRKAFPFRHPWRLHRSLLARLGKTAEARTLLDEQARALHQPPATVEAATAPKLPALGIQ